MIWGWLLVLFPVLIGAVISIAINAFVQDVPVLSIRVDVGTLFFLVCLALSIVAAILMIIIRRIRNIQTVTALRAVEERRRFLQRLDHELKNPLTAILAGLANLGAGAIEEQHRVSLLSVEAQVKRLRDLVADLRKLSDLETREIEHVMVDLSTLLKGLVALTEEEGLKERQLSLSIPQAPWPLPKVNGDWDLLFLAVHNLLQNAIKFTSPGDTIEIRAFEDGDEVVIEVADTGPGIPEEEISHVWEELYRGKGARGVSGSGLGLALVRGIVARHEGRVDLRSRSGHGTVFILRLPAGESRRR